MELTTTQKRAEVADTQTAISEQLGQMAHERYQESLPSMALPHFNDFRPSLSLLTPAYDFLAAGFSAIDGEQRAIDLDVVFFQNNHTDGQWDVGIIDTAKEPTFTEVSPSGLDGAKAEETITRLAEIPFDGKGLDKTSEESFRQGLINRFSPSKALYWAFQESRKRRGELFVDGDFGVCSIGKQDEESKRLGRAVILSVFPQKDKLKVFDEDLSIVKDNLGVRVSVIASELI